MKAWKKGAILLILVLILISGYIKGFKRDISREEIIRCELDDDCIITRGLGVCCTCPISINKQYKGYWEDYTKNSYEEHKGEENCSIVLCEPCGEPIGTKCEDNSCKLIYR